MTQGKDAHAPGVIEADLTWLEGSFRSGIQIELGADGRFGRINESWTTPSERLSGQALLPGMVNAHSHAFQRGLRGKAETYGSGGGNFWSWREQMYALVSELDASRFARLSQMAFEEMLRSGITSVGEFHYLHHLSDGFDYAADALIREAAARTGIRLSLLDVCYLDGDVGLPLEDAQRRFGSASVEAFLKSADRLKADLDPARQTLGLVAHSLRAVPIDAIVTLHEQAKAQGLVFHMHLEEQRQEIERARAHYGKNPLALLLDRLEVGPELTAVHCTHSDASDLSKLLDAGANVCICPLTEANLADGTAPPALTGDGAALSLGTDSNLRIDFAEEMRLLEHSQRLRDERRGVFKAHSGSVAERLFAIASLGGARSLGLDAGRLQTGCLADFFTLDLDHVSLRDVAPEELLSAFVFGADAGVIHRVAVGGRFVI